MLERIMTHASRGENTGKMPTARIMSGLNLGNVHATRSDLGENVRSSHAVGITGRDGNECPFEYEVHDYFVPIISSSHDHDLWQLKDLPPRSDPLLTPSIIKLCNRTPTD